MTKKRGEKKTQGLGKAADGLSSGDYEIGLQLTHRRPFRRLAIRRLAYQVYPVAYSVVYSIGPSDRNSADQIFERVLRAVRRAV